MLSGSRVRTYCGAIYRVLQAGTYSHTGCSFLNSYVASGLNADAGAGNKMILYDSVALKARSRECFCRFHNTSHFIATLPASDVLGVGNLNSGFHGDEGKRLIQFQRERTLTLLG